MQTWVAAVTLLSTVAAAQHPSAGVESPHFPGPHGLSGWIVSRVITGLESQGPLPRELVLVHNRHILRRIEGDFFVWKWNFQDGGRAIAYEAGPLHFSLACFLVDTSSGRQLATYNCYNKDLLAPSTPVWVKDLEKNGHSWEPVTPHTAKH